MIVMKGEMYLTATTEINWKGIPEEGANPLFLDSKATIDLAQDPIAFKKTKHILRHAYWLRDMVHRNVFVPQFVPTEGQLADILTKAARPNIHRRLLPQLLWNRATEDSPSLSAVTPTDVPRPCARGGVGGGSYGGPQRLESDISVTCPL